MVRTAGPDRIGVGLPLIQALCPLRYWSARGSPDWPPGM